MTNSLTPPLRGPLDSTGSTFGARTATPPRGSWRTYAGVTAGRRPERHAPPPGPPPPPHHDSVDQEQAQAIVQRASALLRAHQIDAHERILGGSDSGHALAQASTPDVALFLAAGHGAGTGPKSVGHVARFVVDHALGPVIVVRLRSGAERW